jgi:DNA-binding NarL/FixJ family response regulator
MTKIIIVDDHALVRFGIKSELERNGSDFCVVGEAANGKRFFELLATTHADLVLLDIMLPDISGVEIARRLRNDFPEVKILIISSDVSLQNISQLLELDIDGFLSKQQSVGDDLAEAIRSITDGTKFFGKDVLAIMYDVYVSKTNSTAEPTIEFTERELDIINLSHACLKSREIADKLCISPRTVETHKTNIFKKMGINNNTEMVQYAVRNGIISIDN